MSTPPTPTYTLVKEIGRGGQGSAWLATAPDGSQVVVKRFEADGIEGPEELADARERFRREYEMTSSLDHPNIIPILSANMGIDNPFYVMPVADQSLRAVLESNPSGLDLDRALAIFQRILEGMSFAHRQNHLHRDLKPENVLMFGDSPRVADFGLGRNIDSKTSTLTLSRFGMGTEWYVAPEQRQSLHNAVKASDVFSLGILLFELTTPHTCQEAHLMRDAVPAQLQHIVHKCLEYDPSARYQDCTELLDAITRAIARTSTAVDSRSPKARAQSALISFSNGVDPAENAALVIEILEQSQHDAELYRSFLPKLPKSFIKAIAESDYRQRFMKILRHYDKEFASDNSDFNYTDEIWKFYEKCLPFFPDYSLQMLLIRRILDQAVRNHRYDGARCFARVAADKWNTDPFLSSIAELLAPLASSEKEFIAAYVADFSRPAEIDRALSEPPTKSQPTTDPWASDNETADTFALPDQADPWADDPFADRD
ncbi:serine/threonine protein kinase [Gordonia terrae]|uniref:serine/threonine protein kinase n=1 Tax=Gordonia terrae TaxID=2055 RepID=UPI00200AA20B|nr:serine/threonine-protein kinase [Gordonia terrae]UPW09789.1 serine/threonine protein kinase [Gordonia terrae]